MSINVIKNLKFLLLFLSFPVYSGHVSEISQILIHENTMVVRGTNLTKTGKITLGNKSISIMPAGQDLVLYCKNLNKFPCKQERWVPGSYNLKFFKQGKNKPFLTYPIVITGLEKQERPDILPTIPPTPVTGSGTGDIIPPTPVTGSGTE